MKVIRRQGLKVRELTRLINLNHYSGCASTTRRTLAEVRGLIKAIAKGSAITSPLAR